MPFFTEDEIAGLTINRMSLHIVGGDQEFQTREELQVDHDAFLLAVVRLVAPDPVYQFNETSRVKGTLSDMARDLVSFEQGAQELAHLFHQLHDRTMSEGAFFVFELDFGMPHTRIYALIKYDYRQVLELEQGDGVPVLREILEALVNDRAAVQKSALIRVVDGEVEVEISTQDRMSRKKPDLTNFFERYLEATRSRDDEELTMAARDAVRETLRDTKAQHGQDVPRSVSRAIDVLRQSEVVTEDTIRHAVWVGAGQPDVDEINDALTKAATRHIAKRKLGACEFNPEQGALPRSLKKRITTEEGVTIVYDSGLDGGTVQRERQADGTTVFRIETREFSSDVISDRPGRVN